jgi:hypothetical protein
MDGEAVDLPVVSMPLESARPGVQRQNSCASTRSKRNNISLIVYVVNDKSPLSVPAHSAPVARKSSSILPVFERSSTIATQSRLFCMALNRLANRTGISANQSWPSSRSLGYKLAVLPESTQALIEVVPLAIFSFLAGCSRRLFGTLSIVLYLPCESTTASRSRGLVTRD